MMRATFTVMLLLSTLGGCTKLDVSQPIALVMTGEPLEPWKYDISRAARCWNRQAGSQLVVGPVASAAQRVEIAFDELVCAESHGFTSINSEVEIWLCPPRLYRSGSGLWGSFTHSPPSFHDVFIHELGHVLNIREHGATGIMAGQSSFTAEDHALFSAANPDFQRRSSCVEVPWDGAADGPCDCP